MVLTAIVVAVVTYPSYAGVSPWLGPGIALSVFVAWHSFEASRGVPWIPGLVLATACVQWVLAAWANYVLEVRLPMGVMAVDPERYFHFAVPVTIALACGLYLPLLRAGRLGPRLMYRKPVVLPASLARTCEAMVIGGTLARVFVFPLAPYSIRFAVYLVALLAIVGAFGLMLLQKPGWQWRVLLVLGWMFFYQAADLQFLEVLLWTIAGALLLTYRYRPRLRQVLPIAVVGGMIFLSINAFKTMHRDDLRRESLSAQERASKSSSLITDQLRQPDLLFSPRNLGGQVTRLNEGWVISRILAWVPLAEPFARGETVIDGLRSVFVPRVFDVEKATVGGEMTIPRFTGIELINGTSIGLSVPGELYANFGELGAVAGTFLYALFIGWVFTIFVRRALVSPIWWAWAPYVLFTPISAEQDFSTVVNQIAKAALVMAAVVAVAPGWKELRALGRRPRLVAREPVPLESTA